MASLEPPRKKKLPFKRTVPRKSADAVVPDAPEAALDFFRRTNDVFPMALEDVAVNVEEEEKTETGRQSSPPEKQPDRKRRKVSLEAESERTRSSESTPSVRQSTRRKSSLATDDSDDELIMDVKGKGKEVTRADRTPTPRKPSSAHADARPGWKKAIPVDDDPNFRIPRLDSPTRPIGSSSPVQIIDDSKNVPEDSDSDSGLQAIDEPAEADEFSAWITKAQELQKSNQDVIINVLITSRDPDLHELRAKRRLKQNLKLILDTWISLQRSRGFFISDEEASKLFLTWKGNKIYSHNSAASLGVKVDSDGVMRDSGDGYIKSAKGGLHLEVWTEDAYAKYLEKKEHERKVQMGLVDDDDPFRLDEEEAGTPPAEEKRKGIKVVLKAKDLDPLKITIQDDTTVEVLIAAFRKNRDVQPDQNLAIYFDGERLDEDTLVVNADIDLDDTNQLEVHMK
ncbi:hypothetical protein B0T17DRAFT_618142 [Bombardia bombarda]|uniref:Ubiquitin-like domain-containing protein n=1 Tax=Bombardia bombarda TaxID=252184 RepID=A0AA39WUB3_9PEZI|nr:hypothetical protein B0T17DRAFT_618142 [Bombardia bombarda]